MTLMLFWIAIAASWAFGVALTLLLFRLKVGPLRQYALDIVAGGERVAADLRSRTEAECSDMRGRLRSEESRLIQREEKLDGRYQTLEKKLLELEKLQSALAGQKEILAKEQQGALEAQSRALAQLEATAALTPAEARQQILTQVGLEVQRDQAALIRRAQQQAIEEADTQAARIICTAINRLAVPCISENSITTVSLPSDDIKGRIIGREGRNIRLLEQATGVNFIVDDTPSAVILSGFDPIRKQIAKLALTELVIDGRIHPTRIEEAVDRAKETISKQIRHHGEDAAFRIGAIDLHPELIQLLGRLKFRLSLGQNILEHSLEVAHLMGLMAAELKLDEALAKRIGLLHDIGKAVSHEIPGSHATVGYDLALKYGESEAVANGIGCHHGEMEPKTVEGSLCSAADALSASREGARSEAADAYIRRSRDLERIAIEFAGVDEAYALHAGRELRVVVQPKLVDDAAALCLAKDLSHAIEKRLAYPGKIRVTVLRETRAVEYAL